MAEEPLGKGSALMLKDFDPYDYAKAVRVFQESEHARIRFELFVGSSAEILAIEIVTAGGERCVQTEMDVNTSLLARNGNDSLLIVSQLRPGRWITFEFEINESNKYYSMTINKKMVAEKFMLSADGKPCRIEFRTGKYRLADDVQKWKSGDKYVPGWDEPGADEHRNEAIYISGI